MRAFALAPLALLAACGPIVPDVRTAKAQTELTRELAGKVAGKAVNCLPQYRSSDMTVIDNNTILFRDGKTIYRNDPAGGCSPLGSGSYALLTHNSLGSLCSGDIARVFDTSAGLTVGSCSLSEFIPYRAASAR